MKRLKIHIEKLNIWMIIVFCLTLGLAPFSPPHVLEKLNMLFKGDLVKLIDWFDLFFHGFPWLLLVLKIFTFFVKTGPED